MTRTKTLAAALAASTLLAGAAVAADRAATNPTMQKTSAVDADVGKLSADGATAFRDLHLARLAIFDAKPDQAKALIGKAQAALAKAKTDDAVYLKAEAALKAPAGTTQNGTGQGAGQGVAKGAVQAAGTSAKPSDPNGALAWLPVDGQLTLDDEFVANPAANPAKAGAVTDANAHLAKGDRKGALDRLRLADVKVDFTMAVVPLVKTADGVDQAAKLVADGKYYEANAALKQVEDGMRFDVIDATAVPAGAASADKAATNKADPSATAAKPAASTTH